MNVRIRQPAWKWHELRLVSVAPSQANGIERRLESILASWDGTRYMSGQQQRGVHADCIGFVFSVVDELYGRPTPDRPTLPPDTAMHSREQALATIKALRTLYAPNTRVTDGSIEPGDIVVTGHKDGGPGHVMIVGPYRNTLWHCVNEIGVNQTGLGFADGFERIFGVYRFDDREKWAR